MMRKSPRKSEHDEQAALFQWAALASRQHPELDLLFAIPNGGKRNIVVAKKLKAEGQKAGVPDLLLPVARHGHHGLFIEMKVQGNKLTELQMKWVEALKKQNYVVAVCYGFDEARVILINYLTGK